MEYRKKETASGSTSSGGVVKFTDFYKAQNESGIVDDGREKYLTAKYPNHQMALIKKRLKIEFWIDEQLKEIYEITDEKMNENYEICPDDLVDNLLDIESDHDRKMFVLSQLKKPKKPTKHVAIFVDELLVKVRML